MRAAAANDCAFHLLTVIVLTINIFKTILDKVAPPLQLPLRRLTERKMVLPRSAF